MNMIAAIQLVAQHQQLLEQGLDPRLASLVLGVWFDTVYVPTIQQTQRAWRSTRSRFNAHIRPVLG